MMVLVEETAIARAVLGQAPALVAHDDERLGSKAPMSDTARSNSSQSVATKAKVSLARACRL
ncbi:hypothetical protein ACWGS9_32250 [Bradyrhizobium sp. Arg314]